MLSCFIFFFNDTATTEIYTLSLHDALPICGQREGQRLAVGARAQRLRGADVLAQADRDGVVADRRRVGQQFQGSAGRRSEEHTSELQSRQYLVCRLLLEKKKNINKLSLLCR